MTQLQPPDRIPMPEWLTRCETYFDEHKTEFSRTTQAKVVELFTLHNDKILPRENGMYCSACCGRVYRRLNAEYEKIIAAQ